MERYKNAQGQVLAIGSDMPQDGSIATLAEVSAWELKEAIPYFKNMTDQYIQKKVIDWNLANVATGIEFDSIASFPKYAAIPTDTRYAISIQFLTWNGKIWDAVRLYQSTATTIPTDAEFKAVLDSVVL